VLDVFKTTLAGDDGGSFSSRCPRRMCRMAGVTGSLWGAVALAAAAGIGALLPPPVNAPGGFLGWGKGDD
jgi:hypothetical protein